MAVLASAADMGSRAGKQAFGYLELRDVRTDDRSPRTGEIAVPKADTQACGWTDADFEYVGAPMCQKGSDPAPSSRDPVYPGIVLKGRASAAPTGDADAPELLVGTVGNLRNGEIILDGCGVALSVKRWNGRCFNGSWRNYGIAIDGAGTFALCPSA
jgi:hypothetical protein